MTIMIELSGALEERLQQEAAIRGVSEADYALGVLESTLVAPDTFEPCRSPRRPAAELSALALQQGIKPVERLEDLMGEPGAAEGLDVDAFLNARRDW